MMETIIVTDSEINNNKKYIWGANMLLSKESTLGLWETKGNSPLATCFLFCTHTLHAGGSVRSNGLWASRPFQGQNGDSLFNSSN